MTASDGKKRKKGEYYGLVSLPCIMFYSFGRDASGVGHTRHRGVLRMGRNEPPALPHPAEGSVLPFLPGRGIIRIFRLDRFDAVCSGRHQRQTESDA